MRRMWMTLGIGLFAVSAVAMGPEKKPGLWEVTSNMTWVQSPFPNGAPPSTPNTVKICLTQAMIDKYGGGQPQTGRGQCTTSNFVIKPGHVSADISCTGAMSGKGSWESSWTDPDHTTDSSHFTGEIKMGPNTRPVEWKTTGTSTFISSDCGSVKPLAMPN